MNFARLAARCALAIPLVACKSGDTEHTFVLPSEPFDECASICFPTPDAAVSINVGEGPDIALDAAESCLPPLKPGIHTIVATFDDGAIATADVDVRPFGYSIGLDKPSEPLGQIPWLPAIRRETGPRLVPGPDAWDAGSIMAPSVVEFGSYEYMYYAGTSANDEFQAYQLGVARRPVGSDGEFEKVAGPILGFEDPGNHPESWKNYGQNGPEAEVVGDEVWLFYIGQAAGNGELSIGLATSSDGYTFTDWPSNPVLTFSDTPSDWDFRGVAHPSVIQRDGMFEMWFASGQTHYVGHAISPDAQSWTKSCKNPVFTGVGPIDGEGWDEDEIKAPEVEYADGVYYMSWSGGGHGAYQVGWAASADGGDWEVANEPILPPSGGNHWDGTATREASIQITDAGWRLWYTGNDGNLTRIGMVTLE